jgi:hypothetical protein
MADKKIGRPLENHPEKNKIATSPDRTNPMLGGGSVLLQIGCKCSKDKARADPGRLSPPVPAGGRSPENSLQLQAVGRCDRQPRFGMSSFASALFHGQS